MDALTELPAAAAAADPALGTPPASAPPLTRARIHALRPGTFPAAPIDLTLTVDDIMAMASAYDPTRYQAPVVIGHPLTDDPAWGWVLATSADEFGLWLEVDLLPEMAELIRERRYAAVSVALWTPDAPGNPAPGVWSLRHLGFLGARPPAVKGLQAVRLNADAEQGVLSITCEERSMNQTTPNQTQLSERDAALTAREAALNRRETELRLAGFRAEVEQHVAAGRVTAAEVGSLAQIMERLHSVAAVTLAEGEQATPAIDLLRAHLSALPARVALGEHAAAAAALASPRVPLPKIPGGYRLSESGLDLHTRAVAWQATNKTDYLTAVRAVQAQH